MNEELRDYFLVFGKGVGSWYHALAKPGPVPEGRELSTRPEDHRTIPGLWALAFGPWTLDFGLYGRRHKHAIAATASEWFNV